MKRTLMSIANRLEELEKKLAPPERWLSLTYDEAVDVPLDDAIAKAAKEQGLDELTDNDVAVIIKVGNSV